MVKRKVACALSATAVTLGSGIFVPAVWATSSEDFLNCLQSAESECILSDDVEMSSLYKLDRDLTIDLHGHDITSSTTAKFFETRGHALTITGSGAISTTDTTNTGIIRVYGTGSADTDDRTSVTIGENVTLSGPNPIVVYNTGSTAYNTTIDIHGTLDGYNSGIWMIGTIADKTNYPVINIYDGAEITADKPISGTATGGVAVSAMGYAEWNIGRATIAGVGSGVGIKGGIVNINGADVTGTGDPSVLPPELYNNGINPSGAAIQIEKNTGYPGDIELTITAGGFVSDYNDATIYEYGEADAVKSIGISGGTFNKVFDPSYLAEGYSAYEKPQDVWTVDTAQEANLPDKIVIAKGGTYTFEPGDVIAKYLGGGTANKEIATSDGLTITGVAVGDTTFTAQLHEIGKGFDRPIPVYVYDVNDENSSVKVNVSVDPVDEDSIGEDVVLAISDELGDKKLVGYYDIDAFVTNDGEFIDLVNDITPVEVLLDMPSDLPELKAGFVRKFYLIRYHNGETTTIEAYEKDGKIGFMNGGFSTFALTYEDVEDNSGEEAVAEGTTKVSSPETGTMTVAGASASVAAMATAIVIGVLTSIVSFAYLIRRR